MALLVPSAALRRRLLLRSEGNMINKVIPMLICMLLIGYVPQSYAQADFQRALDLYRQVITGQKEFEELSPEEQRMVIIIHQSLSASDENIEGYGFFTTRYREEVRSL
ncbi:MAG: hypothetical protein U5P41_11450 [Gammaproteobacteria bacterium]|nr:hypothetical protein [Gammaproteobacteria bacterium]